MRDAMLGACRAAALHVSARPVPGEFDHGGGGGGGDDDDDDEDGDDGDNGMTTTQRQSRLYASPLPAAHVYAQPPCVKITR